MRAASAAAGAVMLLLAFACGALLAALLVTASAARAAAEHGAGAISPKLVLGAVPPLAAAAAALGLLGAGCLAGRRWAGEGAAALAWTWLSAGAWGTLVAAALLPRVAATTLAQLPDPWGGRAAALAAVLVASFAALHVALPAALARLLAVGRAPAGAPRAGSGTGADGHRRARLVVGLALLAAAAIALVPLPWDAVPVFGVFVRGAAGVATDVAVAGALIAVALAAFAGRPPGWWGALAAAALFAASSATTLARTGLSETCRQVGIRPDQVQADHFDAALRATGLPWWGAAWVVPASLYLVRRRRAFGLGPAASAEALREGATARSLPPPGAGARNPRR